MRNTDSKTSTGARVKAVSNWRNLRRVVQESGGYNLPRRLPSKEVLASALKECVEEGVRVGGKEWREKKRECAAKASAFLFRKIIKKERDELKEGVVREEEQYLQRMSSAHSHVCGEDCEWKAAVASEVDRLFRYDWDSKYWDYAAEGRTGTSACTENPKKEGGMVGFVREKEWEEWSRGYAGEGKEFEEYLEEARSGREERKVRVLTDDGKYRIVTISSGRQRWLEPLHNLMYDHLARFPWLVRGDVGPGQLKRMVEGEGDFVSGDYEAATDNFCPEHSRWLMERIARRCSRVPEGILALAEARFTGGILVGSSGSVERKRGQLMGDLLSFPFLCLVNYLTAYAALGAERSLLINGDDIAFRACSERRQRWEQWVEKGGLTLSKGKTLVSRWMFSLNSRFWVVRKKKSGMSELPVLRPKTLYKDQGRGLWARWEECVRMGATMEKRAKISRHFLEVNGWAKKKRGRSTDELASESCEDGEGGRERGGNSEEEPGGRGGDNGEKEGRGSGVGGVEVSSSDEVEESAEGDKKLRTLGDGSE
uniref:Putative RdRp n=1 Tax=Leucocoprinus ourmiavirus D TaxID=2592722 RepID=A0A7G3KH60_9VIRU|nr:putative RdRp [Leucocoprinus ourmiavirus D]